MQDLARLLSTPWLGTVLGVLGLLVAVMFYVRSRRISRIAFQLDEFTIVGGSNPAFPQEVEIRFAGSTVDRVTATRVVLWNAGNVTLGGSQIVRADPIRLEIAGEGEILKVDTLRVTRKVNAVNLAPREGSKNVVDVSFDYLDPGDGVTMEVIHSGAKGDIGCHGTMRGVPEGISNFGKPARYIDDSFRSLPFPFGGSIKSFLWVVAAVGMVLTLLGLLRRFWVQWFPSLERTEPSDPTKPLWVMVFAGLLYAVLPLVLLWMRRRRYPSALEPLSKGKSAEPKHEVER